MVLQDLLTGVWQPEQQVGYCGTPQGHYYSTIGPYVSRYGYGPPEFSPMREQIIDPSAKRPDHPQLRLTLREWEGAESKRRQRCEEAMREFSSPQHWQNSQTFLTIVPPTTIPSTIPYSEVKAPEMRTGESIDPTIPKTIESSRMGINPITVTMSNDDTRQDSTSYEVQTMEFTAPLEQDWYKGAYPNFKLPIPGNSRISELFLTNTDLISDANSPMSIIQVPVLEKTFGATIYAINRANGQLYLVEDTKLTALNLYGFLDEQDWPETPNIPMQNPISSKGPQSTSTPITRAEDPQLRAGTGDDQATSNTIPRIPTSPTGMIPPLELSHTISHDRHHEKNLQCPKRTFSVYHGS